MLAVTAGVSPVPVTWTATPRPASGDELQHGDQAGGEQHGAHLGSIAELEHGGDEVHHHHGEKLPDVVVLGILDFPHEKTEIQGEGQVR